MKRILFALAGYLIWRWWSQPTIAEPQPGPAPARRAANRNPRHKAVAASDVGKISSR